MNYEINYYGICFPLTEKGWKALSKIDGFNYREFQKFFKDLARLGAYNINWNGHFGMNLYMRVDSLDDIPAIEEYLKKKLSI